MLGIKMQATIGKGRQSIKDIPASPTLERLDNTKGYVKENICVISHRANKLKGNATLFELKAIAEFTEKMMKERGLLSNEENNTSAIETFNTNGRAV